MRHHRGLLIGSGILAVVVLTVVLGLNSQEVSGAAILVNSSADTDDGLCELSPGNCTLREAILRANSLTGNDTITFDPGVFPNGAPATISPGTALPPSTDPEGLAIDGTGAGVIIDGSVLVGSEHGLHFHTTAGVALTDVTVRDLTVQNFPEDGIRVCAGDPVPCDGDLTDTLIDSVQANDNGERGIELLGMENLRSLVSGGTAAGNGSRGINISAGDNTTDATVSGVTAIGNTQRGININAGDNNTGALVQNSTGNGNGAAGININAGQSTVDPTVTGSTATGNIGDGIVLNGGAVSSGATVTDNESSGNTGDGIATDTSGTYGENTLTGNGGDGFSARELGIVVEDSTISGNTVHAIDGNNGGGMTITGNTITGNMSTASAVRVPGTGNVISNNAITGNLGRGIDNGFADAGSATITGNEVGGNGGLGIATGPLGGHTINDNLVEGNTGRGIQVGGQNSVVTMNTVTANGGEGIVTFDAPAAVHFNRVVGNASGLLSTAGTTVAAENNWWGCNEGPGDADCDAATGDVDFDPWLTLGVSANPDPAVTSQVSALFGAVTVNSDGADTSATGNIPDGTMIHLETDFGSIGSTSVDRPTAGGVAQTAFSSNQAGTANIQVTLDNETVALALVVVDAPGTQTPTATPTPGVTATPSVTPTASSTLTPSPTGSQTVTWGDANCSGTPPDPVDSLITLRFDAGLSTNTGDCPAMGETVDVLNASLHPWGDVDCGGEVNPVDSLKLLRFDAGLSVSQEPGCPQMGTNVAIAQT
ncbi:MAG: right-handed parallel beta-helix repeat-containing protein [Dehalococcoidia bacterium]